MNVCRTPPDFGQDPFWDTPKWYLVRTRFDWVLSWLDGSLHHSQSILLWVIGDCATVSSRGVVAPYGNPFQPTSKMRYFFLADMILPLKALISLFQWLYEPKTHHLPQQQVRPIVQWPLPWTASVARATQVKVARSKVSFGCFFWTTFDHLRCWCQVSHEKNQQHSTATYRRDSYHYAMEPQLTNQWTTFFVSSSSDLFLLQLDGGLEFCLMLSIFSHSQGPAGAEYLKCFRGVSVWQYVKSPWCRFRNLYYLLHQKAACTTLNS